MRNTTTQKLKRLGLDTDFLCWLEGKADRLPHLEAVRKLKDADLAAAIRVTAWLKQLQPEAIAPKPAEWWNGRYGLLESFLFRILKTTMHYSVARTPEDLAALSRVLKALLPESSAKEYLDDMRLLRRNSNRVGTLQQIRKDSIVHKMFRPQRRAGRKPESEQTQRMRAAVAYVKSVSQTPYTDLANFWNECRGSDYDPRAIESRLRKGRPVYRTPEAASDFLGHWWDIYNGQFWKVFPGPFPLTPKLSGVLPQTEEDWLALPNPPLMPPGWPETAPKRPGSPEVICTITVGALPASKTKKKKP